MLSAARGALEAALAEGWADPAALHHAGRRAGLLLDAARTSIARSLGVRPEQVLLADSPAAAARAGIAGLVPESTTIAAPAVEQAVVLDALDSMARGPVRIADVDELGRVRPDGLAGAGAVCLQLANREVGTIQPPAPDGIPWFADAAHVVGHADPALWRERDWTALAVDPVSFGSCPGVGILVVRRGWRPPERVMRGWLGGMPNIAAAIAAATALEWLEGHGPAQAERHRLHVDRIRAAVAGIADVQVLGDPVDRLPHVVTFSVMYASGEALVTELDRRGFAAASGSACATEEARPSHVLAAMGAYTGGNVRVCLPYDVEDATVDRFIAELPSAVDAVRGPL
jgi:cysteine desulfurase